MDPVRAIAELGGGARAVDILRRGVTWPELRAAVATGRVLRPALGTYVTPLLDRERTAAAALRGHVGCVSACGWWGVKSVRPPDALHLVFPTNRGVAHERIRPFGMLGVHREADYACDGLVECLDTAVDHAARCTRPIEQLVLVESAMKLGKLDPLAPSAFACGSDRRRAWLLQLAAPTSQSVPESVAKAVLDAAGFRPRAQDPHDGVGHVDLGVGVRHGVEVDGWDTHGTKEAFAEDRRRDREMAARKKWPLRYTYADVMRDPRAFGLDVSRVIGVPVDVRFDKRMQWLMGMPPGHLNRRVAWSPPGA